MEEHVGNEDAGTTASLPGDVLASLARGNKVGA